MLNDAFSRGFSMPDLHLRAH